MNIKTIGVIENGYPSRQEAPRQGYPGNRFFVLNLKEKYADACVDFQVGDTIQVVYYGHRSNKEVLKNRHPRLKKIMGVFSTRSPDRPNPILISLAKIEAIRGTKITVSGLEALDQSPVLDIKGYTKEFHEGLFHQR